MIFDTFQAFGAEPVTTPANQIYEALKTGRVGAQENPLAVLEGLRLYEVVKYVSMTNHMWSGFNQMAHLATWRALPADISDVIARNVTKYVGRQRVEQGNLNASLRDHFTATASCSTRSTRRRSAPGWARSTRPGRTSSARSAGRCWRPRSASWGNRSCPHGATAFDRAMPGWPRRRHGRPIGPAELLSQSA